MYQNIVVTKVTDTEVELTGEIPTEYFEGYRARALKNIQSNLELPGFRKGHVPENVINDKFGPTHILEEMAEMALADAYPKIVDEHKLDAVDRPRVHITKLAAGNPLGFKIHQTVIPEIALPDYVKLAEKTREVLKKDSASTDSTQVSDEEVNTVLEEIKKARKLETLDDTNVKDVGPFASLEELKLQLRENIASEKKLRDRERVRGGIVEAILKETNFVVPAVLIERELDRYIGETKMRLEQAGATWEAYLGHAKKTEAELRESAKGDAEKHVRTRLVLEAIGKHAEVQVSEEEANKETEALISRYPGTDPMAARDYVVALIKNTRVLELLDPA